MQLQQLLTKIQPEEVVGFANQMVAGLAFDSRHVAAEMVFFALPGVHVDGFAYVPQALQAGATVVVAEQLPEGCSENICYIKVANVRRAMALMAAEFYGNPSENVKVIGITGTNGKTTTTYLLEAMFKQAGYGPAVFGTIEYRFGNLHYDASHTTPESIDLLRMMAEFSQQGANVMILEVSSHALDQHRVDGISFDAAVFTNLTQDHLDYHNTLDHYFLSKKRLFAELLNTGVAIINRDDSYGLRLLQEIGSKKISYGMDLVADLHPTHVSVGRDGISGSVSSSNGNVAIESGMIGSFNVSNLLAAIATAQQLGVDNTVIASAIASATQVPGRVESIENSKGALVLVDYAHTPDALEQVLKTLVALDGRRIITVVGCGGDRDKTKRPLMAAVAVRYSSFSIFTSDNPRTEEPSKILEQVRAGALAAGSEELGKDCDGATAGFVVIQDRRKAIELACSMVTKNDILLVAGKGHEDYQIIGREKLHFDDREELRRVLNEESTVAFASTKAGAEDCV